MKLSYDLAIVGAGPAGMAAAIEAERLGLSVIVIDEQPFCGGQIFRSVESAKADPALRGEYSTAGAELARRFRSLKTVDYSPSTALWHLSPDIGRLSLVTNAHARKIDATHTILALGAQERPVPIDGWTLPGVMTAGAAQIMLKTAGAVPVGKVVIAGQGPLTWLLAVQLLRAGVKELTLLETRSRSAFAAALQAGGIWRGRSMLRKGALLILEAQRRGLQVLKAVRDIRAVGQDKVCSVRWDRGQLLCDTLLLHEGIIPSTHITRALGLLHEWNPEGNYWQAATDTWGATSHARVSLAGDGSRIVGWEASIQSGRLAAINAAFKLGRISRSQRDAMAVVPKANYERATALRAFLERLYRPPASVMYPDDDVVVCRCEEVTAGAVRNAARLGALGPNQAKAYLRTGMGPCQGRMCGTTVSNLIEQMHGLSPEQVGWLRPRAPYKPISVGSLASANSPDLQ